MLRKYLRFVRSVAHLYQEYPANSTSIPFYDGITGVSDASWGSSDAEQRRSISGGVIYWKGSVIKGYSRMQHCITLSSCESEVIAVCQISQECIGLRHLVEFLENFADPSELARFHEKDLQAIAFDQIGSSGNRETYPIIVFSDSQSCLAALQNQGLSRRVRHMSLATCFIQSLVESGHLVLRWISGKLCVADLLTKILNREATEFHRCQIGITERTAPESWQFESKKKSKVPQPRVDVDAIASSPADVQPSHGSSHEEIDEQSHEGTPSLSVSVNEPDSKAIHDFRQSLEHLKSQIGKGQVSHVLVDLFTTRDAGFSQLCGLHEFRKLGIIPVTKECKIQVIKNILTDWLCLILDDVLVLCWSSPPCTGGSPVLNLIAPPRRFELQETHFREFAHLLNERKSVMSVCHLRCLELSSHSTYWKSTLVQTVCQDLELRWVEVFPRCTYQIELAVPARHMFRVCCNIKMCQPKVCTCSKRQSLNGQHLHDLARYPRKLAAEFASWFLSKTRASVAAN